MAVVAAGCSSSSQNSQPTVSAEQQAALNATLEKAAQMADLEGDYSSVEATLKTASFLPPPTLNKSAVNGGVAIINIYKAYLGDFKSASTHYRTFLANDSSEYRQALDNESAADTKLKGAADLKKALTGVNNWLAEYGIWNPINDSAGQKIKDMYLFASITDPTRQMSPADGVLWFNEARPIFVSYLNESTVMINSTDSLLGLLANGSARDSLDQFKNNVQAQNDWVKTNYNQMVDTFNQMVNKKYGTQSRL
jgi:hypothetical protein